MFSATELILEDAARQFLDEQHAHDELETVVELIDQCFPNAVGVRVELLVDPDEIGRVQLACRVALPTAVEAADCLQGMQEFHVGLVERLALDRCSLFTLLTDFA